MKYFFLIVAFLPLKLFSQCDYYYYYAGKSGEVIEDSFPVVPNDLYRIDIATLNVPDGFTIYNNKEKTDSLFFYIGRNNIADTANHFYVGYCEFEYDGTTLITNKLGKDTLPFDYHVDSVTNDPRGGMRLYYWVPDSLCNFVFKVWGNKIHHTVYAVCIKKLANGYIPVTDTIHQPFCGEKNPIFIEKDCKRSMMMFDNYSINDIPIVHHNGCAEDLGWVEFPQYPQFNKHDLKIGTHTILVSNQYCEKQYTIEIPEKQICQYYVPNVVRLDGENNGQFVFYTKNQHPYWLTIFDRWGNAVFRKEFISNISGWDGKTVNGENVGLGVYVYQIECVDLKLTGDVTVLK